MPARIDRYNQLNLCKFYTNYSELGAMVTRGLISLFESNPSIGWVRGKIEKDKKEKTTTPSSENIEEIKAELYRINKKMDDLLYLQK